jgi:hypothetical protein
VLVSGDWYIPLERTSALHAYVVSLVVKKGTKAHAAFTDWHNFLSTAGNPPSGGRQTIFGFKNQGEIGSEIRKLCDDARLPARYFNSSSLRLGAMAQSYALDLFAGKSIEHAIENLSVLLKDSEKVDEDAFRTKMNGLQEVIRTAKIQADRDGKSISIHDLELEAVHPDLAWKTYNDIPTPKRATSPAPAMCIGSSDSYEDECRAILRSMKAKDPAGMRTRRRSTEHEIAARIYGWDDVPSSFVEASRALMDSSREYYFDKYRSWVVKTMIHCRYMTRDNWESCEVPVYIVEYFGLKPKKRGKKRIAPIQRTHDADRSTDKMTLWRHTKKRLARSRSGKINSMPLLNNIPIVDYQPNHPIFGNR